MEEFRMSFLFAVASRDPLSRDPVKLRARPQNDPEIRGSLQTARSTPLLSPDEEEGNQAEE